jgi:hypothetical protein
MNSWPCAATPGAITEGQSRRPKAESRRPKAEGRKPKAESRKPTAESRKPKAESRKPTAESRKPKAEGRKPKAESRKPTFEPRIFGLHPCPTLAPKHPLEASGAQRLDRKIVHMHEFSVGHRSARLCAPMSVRVTHTGCAASTSTCATRRVSCTPQAPPADQTFGHVTKSLVGASCSVLDRRLRCCLSWLACSTGGVISWK